MKNIQHFINFENQYKYFLQSAFQTNCLDICKRIYNRIAHICAIQHDLF